MVMTGSKVVTIEGPSNLERKKIRGEKKISRKTQCTLIPNEDLMNEYSVLIKKLNVQEDIYTRKRN